MKHSLPAVLVALSLCACGPDSSAMVGDDFESDGIETYDAELTSSSRSTTWFPFRSGNSWTFRSSSGATRTVQLTQVSDGMGLLTGLFERPVWVGLTTDTSTTLQMWSGNAWVPFIRFGYATTTWRTSSQVCTGLVGRRTGTGGSFTTAAGTYTDTRTIGFSQVSDPATLCAPQAFGELVFAANVGLVSFKTGSNQRFNLVSARVNGRTIPVPATSDITARVSLDKAGYVSIPNTIRCITTPCDSNAQTAEAQVTFELRNTGTTAKTWDFSTGCQFDVEVVSSSGAVVSRLSEGRACTFALSSLTLTAGQSKTYSATLTLEDRTGLQLDGNYTVRAKLIPSGTGTAPSATAPLSVQVLVP